MTSPSDRWLRRAGFKLIEIGELLALDATQDRDRIQTLATARIVRNHDVLRIVPGFSTGVACRGLDSTGFLRSHMP